MIAEIFGLVTNDGVGVENLNVATDAINEDMDAFGLGAICGQLRTLKNRFGF